MLPRPLFVTGTFLLMFAACSPGTPLPIPDKFEPTVNPNVQPAQATIPDAQGNPQTVSSSRDDQGVQSDFLEGLVLVRPAPGAELNAFLSRYEGTVVSDDTVPEPPAALGITLTEEQRRPTEYLVRINLAKVDVSNFVENGTLAGLAGVMEFSSQAGLQTLAGVADAVAAGFDASPEYVSYADQAFPMTIFSTQERPDGAGGFTDAFATTRFQASGSQSNVTLAWQFLAAHGIERRTRVAIIDDGFWLNPNGTPRGTDFDFPANPIQYDFVQNDYFADGAGITGCGPGNPCFWHGTGSTGVAAGIINNQSGAAGTGGLIGDPILLRTNGQRSNGHWAIRTAVAWGADVVSMSWGGDCNEACRIYDRENTPISDAINSGSRAVFLAAAGNGDSAGVGYDVGDPHFVHPCIEDHVICIGALNNDATTRIGYSNFGDGVDIFAPTNIPVMSSPASTDSNPAGSAAPRSFGGTSAATPFVAGVAAMMKAINPDLNNDAVAAILRGTAHPGAGQVSRYIDAYAAVRRAAESIPVVNDRFEDNDLTPTDLGSSASYNQANLNVDGRDRDYFKFESAGGSTMTVDLEHPEGLGAVTLLDLQSLGDCGEPVLVSDAGLGGRGRRYTYRVPGGPLQLAVKSDDINAYNLAISFASPTIAADGYEANDLPSTARWIYSFKSIGSGPFSYFGIEPRVTIDGTIHTATDVDYYIVRGPLLTAGERILLVGYPTVKVYANESPTKLEVYRLNEDNTPGALVGTADGGGCVAQALTVRLEADAYYLVKVSGTPGRYSLRNGVDGDRRYIPQLVRDSVYILLNPGEPVEHRLRFAETFVFARDTAYSRVRVAGPNQHMRLFDFDGALLSEGQPDDQNIGERLSLATTAAGQVYALRIEPQGPAGEEQNLVLNWDASEPAQVSANLIVNPGAEIIFGPDPEQDIPYWDILLSAPRIFFYDDQEGNPSPSGPGPDDRGLHLFAGGPSNTLSQIRQLISVDPAWEQPINEGRVNCRFSAFLGGYLEQPDRAGASLTFLDSDFRTLGELGLPAVTSRDREGATGLFPVQTTDDVPAGTAYFQVDVTFEGADFAYNDGYADNLELILSRYAP